MQQLIKITSVPMQTVRYTQNARLVSSASVDIERRKALARQMSFHRSAGRHGLPLQDIAKINRVFSKNTATDPQGEQISPREAAFQQVQPSAATATPVVRNIAPAVMTDTDASAEYSTHSNTTAAISVSAPVSSAPPANIHSSYAAERGAFEMKIAKGDLTFLPPIVMTIVTQYPDLHFEYLGGFNYVGPQSPQTGGTINLAT